MATLYHYTSAAGLKGILEEKAFWASEYRFLNDLSKFNYGWHMLFDELVEANDEIESISREASEMLGALCDNIFNSGVYGFVASLTTEGDLLSQWRGYSNGKGFAIGINSEWLSANADAQGFNLIPVVYDENSQKKSCANAIELLLRMLKEVQDEPGNTRDIVTGWWKHGLKVAIAFKTHHFAEEHEYRLAYILDSWPTTMKTRIGAQGLIPYVPCYFNHTKVNKAIFHPNNLGLERIIIGPAARESQKIGVDALLASHHMRFEVTNSDIPYVAD